MLRVVELRRSCGRERSRHSQATHNRLLTPSKQSLVQTREEIERAEKSPPPRSGALKKPPLVSCDTSAHARRRFGSSRCCRFSPDAMVAVRSSCARCWRAGQQRALATNAAPPRRRSPSSSKPTPEHFLQQHPAFKQPTPPPRPKQRTPPTPLSARPTPPPPVRLRPAVREPPLVERARQKTVGERSVWESYLGAF